MERRTKLSRKPIKSLRERFEMVDVEREVEGREFISNWTDILDLIQLCDAMHNCDTCTRAEPCHAYIETINRMKVLPQRKDIWNMMQYIRQGHSDGKYFLTKEQAALEYGCSSSTMRRWCRLGLVKTTVVGFSELISLHEWDRFKREGNHPDADLLIERRKEWAG